MADRSINKQMQAFARVDGAYLGLIWIISFSLFIMQYSDPIMGFLGMFVSVYSLAFAYKRLVKYRRKVCGDVLNFFGAYVYMFFMFFYASIILGIAQYIYFKFIDGGFLVNTYAQLTDSEEFKEAAKVYGMSIKDMDKVVKQLYNMRPVDITWEILSMNVSVSFFLSIPMALFARKNNTK